MIRITGGERKGMILAAPRGHHTRPATSRIRQWIFDVLGPPAGLRALDLFAGTGAVGLEALSRGAERVLFVESWKPALDTLRANIEKTGYSDRSEVWPVEVRSALATLAERGDSFDLCFCDPPYAFEGLEELLENSVLDLLATAGTLVVEHRGDPPLAPGGRRSDREKTFGDTILSLWMGI
jgi:16S rRNA (guanine(966)-N(2))-methyltransferase RsmD